jgi:hypothetical protein
MKGCTIVEYNNFTNELFAILLTSSVLMIYIVYINMYCCKANRIAPRHKLLFVVFPDIFTISGERKKFVWVYHDEINIFCQVITQ